MPEESAERGLRASIDGFANEKIVCGMLMKRYGNVSLVDLPLSSFDIIVVRKMEDESEDIVRVQSKTATKSVSFTGGSRGGVDRVYKSDVKTYVQTPKHSDCIVGIHFTDDKPELYFIPTMLIEELDQKSISINKIQPLKNNYDILENCKDREFVIRKAREYRLIS